MKVSQNLYADTLLKALGAVNRTGTVTAGRDAVIAALRDWKIDEQSLVMADGSGLSDTTTSPPTSSRCRWSERTWIAASRSFHGHICRGGERGDGGHTPAQDARGGQRASQDRLDFEHARPVGLCPDPRWRNRAFSIIANDFIIPAATVNWITDLAVETLANFTRHPRHH